MRAKEIVRGGDSRQGFLGQLCAVLYSVHDLNYRIKREKITEECAGGKEAFSWSRWTGNNKTKKKNTGRKDCAERESLKKEKKKTLV